MEASLKTPGYRKMKHGEFQAVVERHFDKGLTSPSKIAKAITNNDQLLTRKGKEVSAAAVSNYISRIKKLRGLPMSPRQIIRKANAKQEIIKTTPVSVPRTVEVPTIPREAAPVLDQGLLDEVKEVTGLVVTDHVSLELVCRVLLVQLKREQRKKTFISKALGNVLEACEDEPQ